MKKTLLMILTISLLTSCGLRGAKKGSSSQNEADSDEYLADSATSIINGALNDSEQVNSYAKNKTSHFVKTAYADQCGLNRFSPTIGSANCSSTLNQKTVTSFFNSCEVGPFILKGTVSLNFDVPATCNLWIQGMGFPNAGSVTRTTQDFMRLNPNGSAVFTNSDFQNNYLGQSIGGGVRTNFYPGSRTIDILGINRYRRSAFGQTVYSHSIKTTAPLSVTGSKVLGNRQVSSGTIQVDHNLARYTSLVQISSLMWSANCCHPVNGQLQFNWSGSRTGTLIVDFSTGSCGEANLTRNGENLGRVSLASCE